MGDYKEKSLCLMRPKVFAHRGIHRHAPENSMASFHLAIDLGVDGIETDVQLDRHGVPILFHDRLLADGRLVAELSREEISLAMGYEVPLLREALSLNSDILWNIEIKAMDAVRPATEVMSLFADRKNILVSSFIHAAVDRLVQDISIPGALLVSHSPIGPLLNRQVLAPGVKAIVWDCGTVDDEALGWAKSVGLYNLVYGFQSSAEHSRFLRSDVAAVITDFPIVLLAGDTSVTDGPWST